MHGHMVVELACQRWAWGSRCGQRQPAPAHSSAQRPRLPRAGKDIEKSCQGIYPLQSVYIRKVKVLRAPKFDVTKLMEVHGDYAEETGTKVARPATTEEQPEAEAAAVDES